MSDIRRTKELYAQALAERLRRKERAKHEAPGGLIEFVKYFWDVLEPETKFIDGWAMRAICLHLEAVDDGRIKRLLINVPPGFSKSLISNVFFPAWRWSAKKKPHLRFLSFSYSSHLTERDNAKMRDLIKSPKFQFMYGLRFKLTREGQELLSTDKTGWKLASSVGGVSTGERGDTVTCLPRSERILTDAGWLKIGDVVENRMPVKVAGSLNGRLVWQSIEKYEQNPGGAIYEVRWAGGSVRCTADHPIYVHSRGYVRADEVAPGDEIVRAPYRDDVQMVRRSDQSEAVACTLGPLLQQAVPCGRGVQRVEDREQPPVYGVLEACVSTAGAFGQDARGAVLQPGMPGQVERRRAQFGVQWRQDQILRAVRQDLPVSSQAEPILLKHVLWSCGARPHDHRMGRPSELPALQCAVHSHKQDTEILHEEVRRSQPRLANEGEGERQICARGRPEGVSAGMVQVPQGFYPRQGRQSMPPMPSGTGAGAPSGCSPHRLRKAQPQTVEPDYALQVVSRQDAWASNAAPILEREAVLSVERIGYERTTYNVSVAPAHNYFAGDGALVHNCDDANSVKSQESRIVREETNRWFMEGITNRLNNATESAIIVIQQRLHDDDLAGAIIAANMGYELLLIPMAYDPRRHCKTSIGWEDPRRVEGELAWPERFPEASLAVYRKQSFMWSSQYQQTPQVRGGNIFKYEWWKPFDMKGARGLPSLKFTYIVASVDTSMTKKTINDPSACTVWGVFVDDKDGLTKALLLAAWEKHLELTGGSECEQRHGETDQVWVNRTREKWGLVEWIVHTCRVYKVDRLLIEATAAGHPAAQALRNLTARNFAVQLYTPKGDKETRAHAVTYLFAEEMVYAPADSIKDVEGSEQWEYRKFARLAIEQMARFPRGKDDIVDTASAALQHLRDVNALYRKIEAREAEDEERRNYHEPEPLYPG